MKNKMWVLMMSVSLLAAFSAFGQEQSQGTVATQTPLIDLQGVRNYLLGPGDVLDIRVFAQPDLNTPNAEIDTDGNITSLPFIEKPIRAMCRTEKEVQKDISTAYAAYIRNPQVSVRIAQRNSRPPASVMGAVRTPMLVTMMRRVRLHELLARSGGFTERFSGTVQIVHTQPEMCPEPGESPQLPSGGVGQIETVRLSLLKNGKDSADPYIRPGDVVNFTEGDPIYITGAVLAPREIFMKDQLTLGHAIAMAGGTQRLANTSQVHVYRQRDGKIGQDDLTFNYDAIRKGREKDVLLEPNDIIEVRQSGALAPKTLADFFLNMGKGTVGYLPQRVFIY
jgi:polysaccharide export outer membrane protein